MCRRRCPVRERRLAYTHRQDRAPCVRSSRTIRLRRTSLPRRGCPGRAFKECRRSRELRKANPLERPARLPGPRIRHGPCVAGCRQPGATRWRQWVLPAPSWATDNVCHRDPGHKGDNPDRRRRCIALAGSGAPRPAAQQGDQTRTMRSRLRSGLRGRPRWPIDSPSIPPRSLRTRCRRGGERAGRGGRGSPVDPSANRQRAESDSASSARIRATLGGSTQEDDEE